MSSMSFSSGSTSALTAAFSGFRNRSSTCRGQLGFRNRASACRGQLGLEQGAHLQGKVGSGSQIGEGGWDGG